MTKRSPRRTENRIQEAGQEAFRTRPVQEDPGTSQSPVSPAQTAHAAAQRSTQTVPGAAQSTGSPERDLTAPAKPVEKPALHVVEPPLWDSRPLNSPAAPGRRQGADRERPAIYAPDPELRTDMLHRQPRLSPELQSQRRQAAREEQIRRMERQKESKPALRTDMPRREDGQTVPPEKTPPAAVINAQPQTRPAGPDDARLAEQTRQVRPDDIRSIEQTRQVTPVKKKIQEPPRPLRPTFEKTRAQTRSELYANQVAEAQTKQIWPSEERAQAPTPAGAGRTSEQTLVRTTQTRPSQQVRPVVVGPDTQEITRPAQQAGERPQTQARPAQQAGARVQAQPRPAQQTGTRAQAQARPARPAVSQQESLPKEDYYAPRSRSASRSSNKVFSKAFKRGFLITWAVFVVLLIAAMVLLWTRLQKYEKGLPDHTIEAVCEEVGKGNLSGLHPETADGRALTDESLFVEEATIGATLQKRNEETPLSYVKVNAESGEDQNVYLIRSGDHDLLKVYLTKGSGDEGWKETKTVLSGEDFTIRKLKAQIPSDGTLLLGETEIPRTCVTEQGAQISLLSKLIEEGIVENAPTLDTYTVEGIFPDVKVQMKTKDGKTVFCSKTDDVYIAGFEADEAFAKEQSDYVVSLFEPYATYFSGDAKGDVLHDIMLSDSPAYESASSADVSWMQEHDDVRLSEERAENFRKYTDDCYSCDIHFLQDIYQNGEVVRTWDTNMTWILVKDGDKYYIADFVTKTEG